MPNHLDTKHLEKLLDLFGVGIIVAVVEFIEVWESVRDDFGAMVAGQACAVELRYVFPGTFIAGDCVDFGMNDRTFPKVGT